MPNLTPTALALSGLIVEVFRCNGAALAAGDRLTKPAGLTSARWQVLGVLGSAAAPVAHVARTMGLTRQSVQLTANALVRDGFLRFVDNPHHQRAKLLEITAAGRRALRRVEAQHPSWAHRIGRSLPLAELERALRTLTHVREQLEADAAITQQKRKRRVPA